MRPKILTVLLLAVLAACSLLPDASELERWRSRVDNFEQGVDVAEPLVLAWACPAGDADTSERCRDYRTLFAEIRGYIDAARTILGLWSSGRMDPGIARDMLKLRAQQMEDAMQRLREMAAADGHGDAPELRLKV